MIDPKPAKLTKVDDVLVNGRALELAKNGGFWLVEKQGEGPYGEPHYGILDLASTPEAELRLLAVGLLQVLGEAITERNGLKRSRIVAEDTK